VYAFLFSAVHATCPVHVIFNNIWNGIQIMRLLVMRFSPVSCHFLSLSPKYLPQHSNTLSMTDQVSHT
jgi:hypothetical protein